MNEVLFFLLGLVIGGLSATTIMCCLQINRINDYETEIKKLKEKNKENINENKEHQKTSVVK